jgi:hypothetical protein
MLSAVALNWFGDTAKSKKTNSNEILENIGWQWLERKYLMERRMHRSSDDP